MTAAEYRRKLHRAVFALAPKVHPEAAGKEEILEAIREDIVLWKIGAKLSLSVLSIPRLRELVNAYRRSIGQSAPPPKIYERTGHCHHPDALITAEQQAKINTLFDELGYDAEGRRRLSRRVCKKDWPQTRRDANKMSQCLLDMRSRGYHPPTNNY